MERLLVLEVMMVNFVLRLLPTIENIAQIGGVDVYFQRAGDADYSEYFLKQNVSTNFLTGQIITYDGSFNPRPGVVLAQPNSSQPLVGIARLAVREIMTPMTNGTRGDDL